MWVPTPDTTPKDLWWFNLASQRVLQANSKLLPHSRISQAE